MADSTPEPKSLDEKSEAELKREAKARLRRLSPVAAASVVEEALGEKARKSASGFVAFLRERAIVGLAIGFVIGTQVQLATKQFIADFVNPLFKLLIPGDQTLTDRTWVFHLSGRSATFAWGDIAYQLLDLMFIIMVIYVVVRLFKLDHLDKKS